MGSFSNSISQERFLEVYNKHLPGKWEKLGFKYFSTNTLKEDRWLPRIFFIVAFLLFGTAFILTLFGASHIAVGIPTYTLVGWCVIFAIFRFPVFFIHKFRIRKIRKELGVSLSEYDILASMYL